MKRENTLLRVLLLNKSSNDAEYLLNTLRKGGFATRPQLVDSKDGFQAAIEQSTWDLILAAADIGGMDVMDFLSILSLAELDIPTIITVDRYNKDETIGLLRAGAKDVIMRECTQHLVYVAEREYQNLEERRARRRLEAKVREIQRRSEELLEVSQGAIAYVLDGVHINVNQAYTKLFGLGDAEEFDGLPIMDLVEPDQRVRFKKFLRDLRTCSDRKKNDIALVAMGPNGGFKVEMEFSPATLDGEDCHQVVAMDLSNALEQKKLERDSLTALYSHEYFLGALEDAVAAAVEEEKRGFLLYVELDNFQIVKDAVGILESDEIIADIAGVMQARIGPGQILARFGDVTFTVLLPDNNPAVAQDLVERLIKAVGKHVTETQGKSITVACSIGLAPITEITPNVQEILTRAANACQLAKEDGGGGFHISARVTEREVELADSALLVQEIREAMAEDSLSLRFQPIVGLHGETEEIYEVSLRVKDREGRPIPSGEVFKVAEETGMARDLDRWVMKNVLHTLEKQRKSGANPRFFIKLSEQAVMDETMVLNVAKQCKAMKLRGENLIFEISETFAKTQVKMARAFVKGLKQLHCKTALEYFGSGLNSFDLIKHVDVDYLKLDGSFIQGVANNPLNQREVRNMTVTGQSLGKQTIAPCVEDAGSLAILWQCGVNYAQGDYIQAPQQEMDYDFTS